jgi:hypothetical protein
LSKKNTDFCAKKSDGKVGRARTVLLTKCIPHLFNKLVSFKQQRAHSQKAFGFFAERCVRDELEFKFPGGGGRATGRFAIVALVLLAISAMIVIAVTTANATPLRSAIIWVARIRGP